MAYADVVLEDSPVGYWRLGDGAGAAAALDSIAARNATYTGPLSPAQAHLLVGDTTTSTGFASGQYAQVASGATFALATVSIEAWVHPTAPAPTSGGMIAIHNVTGSYSFYVAHTTQHLSFNNVNNVAYDSGVAIATNATSHVVATVSGTTLTFYVNGASVNTQAISALNTTSAVLDIGNDHAAASSGFLPGTMQELAIYATALPAGRVQAHYVEGALRGGVVLG